MSPSSSLTSRVWIAVPLCALALLCASYFTRIQRVKFVTAIAQEKPLIVSVSPTGYAGGTRELVVPEHVAESYGWIAQTQHMLTQGDWRVRRIDYENAPVGRTVHTASPYRWWLGLVAWLVRLFTGEPIGLAVENAALIADPLLHLLFLVAMTIFVRRQFGVFSATLCCLGGAMIFPLAAGFLPGAPDDFGLGLLLAISSTLPLIAGICPAPLSGTTEADRWRAAVGDSTMWRWFFAAGILGGLAMWVNVASEASLLVGVLLGAVLAALTARRVLLKDGEAVAAVLPWQAWGLGGSITVLLAYLLEYYPAYLGEMELRVIHPLYGLAWWGAAELLGRAQGAIQKIKTTEGRFRQITIPIFAFGAVAALPVCMWRMQNLGVFAVDLLSFRLTKQPDGVMAPNLAMWLTRDGATPVAWATFVPVLLLAVAGWLIFRSDTVRTMRLALALALGPALVALGLAYVHLRNWQMFDGALLVVIATATMAFCSGASLLRRGLWTGVVVAVLLPGWFQLMPRHDTTNGSTLTLPEVEGLVERDLAHWLAKRIGAENDSVILAPPRVSNTLYYYGRLRGLASLDWENKDGLSVALRMVISTSSEEAHALVRSRGVTHIVVPSWDPFFEEYTRSASIQNGELFLTGLHRWGQPNWLRPIPYQLPTIAGFDQQSVLVFEVVDDQSDALALSALTEYFIEMGQIENAKAAGQALKRFPADFGALIARAQLESALGDAAAFKTLLDLVLRRLAAGSDRTLPWDRRVSLATVLARGEAMEKAKSVTQRCLGDISETRLRSLTTYSLYHLLGLSKACSLQIADPRLRDLAWDLLPGGMSEKIRP